MPVDTPPHPDDPAATANPRATRARLVVRGVAILVAAAFVALLAYGLVKQAPETTIDDRLARAQTAPAPGFELELLHRGDPGARLSRRLSRPLADGRLALGELRGTPVVLNFWASWCVPCREEAPLLERTWREDGRPRGVLFLGLNMQDVREDARAFLREFDVSYPNVRDRGKTVAPEWGVTGIPETFFITAHGEIAGHVIGVISAEQMRDGIAAAVSGRPMGALSGGDRRATQ
jgi:cytochrome c biogenesis protein CcmG/thiol:disulfide interchange protein DsbE